MLASGSPHTWMKTVLRVTDGWAQPGNKANLICKRPWIRNQPYLVIPFFKMCLPSSFIHRFWTSWSPHVLNNYCIPRSGFSYIIQVIITYIPPSIVLPIQQLGVYCDNFPPWGLQGKLWLIIPSPCIFSLQSTTLSDYSTDFTSFFCDSK